MFTLLTRIISKINFIGVIKFTYQPRVEILKKNCFVKKSLIIIFDLNVLKNSLRDFIHSLFNLTYLTLDR